MRLEKQRLCSALGHLESALILGSLIQLHDFDSLKLVFASPNRRQLCCSPEMPTGQSFRKTMRESKEETSVGDTKPCRKKNGCLFKKKLSALNFFPGNTRNVMPQDRNSLFDEKKRGLQRKESKKLKAPKEEICSLGKPHSGKMCPKCEILLCRACNTLHTESSFIAHSLLDHYDKGRPSCSSDSGTFPPDRHVCERSLGPAWLMSDLTGSAH
ncbi:hypothetical protein lerEdw1_008111 [Lerista edwardsae]|nr:hypothetical protein lerEdw1_008111 [Lerista edwardsae]